MPFVQSTPMSQSSDMSTADDTEVDPEVLTGEFRLVRQLRLAQFDAAVAQLSQTHTTERLARLQEDKAFQKHLFDQIVHLEKREKRLKAQHTFLQTELVEANEREREALVRCDHARNEAEEMTKEMKDKEQALRAAHVAELDEKKTEMQVALDEAKEKETALLKRYEEDQEKMRCENEVLRSKIAEATLIAHEKEISSASEGEPVRLSDIHPGAENVEEASDPEDGAYMPETDARRCAHASKATTTGGVADPERCCGIISCQEQDKALPQTRVSFASLCGSSEGDQCVRPVESKRPGSWLCLMCSRVQSACKGSKDPNANAVLPFEIVLPPVLQKRGSNKRKLVSRSATSQSAGIGMSDEIGGEEDTRASKSRNGKEKPWQVTVK